MWGGTECEQTQETVLVSELLTSTKKFKHLFARHLWRRFSRIVYLSSETCAFDGCVTSTQCAAMLQKVGRSAISLAQEVSFPLCCCFKLASCGKKQNRTTCATEWNNIKRHKVEQTLQQWKCQLKSWNCTSRMFWLFHCMLSHRQSCRLPGVGRGCQCVGAELK